MISYDMMPTDQGELLVAIDERWNEVPYWVAIAKNASRWTPDYLLAAVDLRRGTDGGIERMPPDQRVFGPILLRAARMSEEEDTADAA